MAVKFDISLMVKVAQMFYMNDMEQEEIAESLKLSSKTVSNLLSDAVEFGIVDIKIRSLV